MRKFLCIILSFFVLSLSVVSLFGQEARPKVGLVLSGGSAHGLSHIGVLRVLEEQGVQVDYITGTSIGSIIGGLYAMGMNAKEIEELTEAQDWSELLTTEVPLNDVAPSEKLYHNRYSLTMEVRDGGIKLPQGFFSSQKLDLLLNRIYFPAHNIHNFDSLPYPFKCVSVNIENGDVEVLEKGYLGDAIRSSMAIPSVFAPVEMEGKLLVDGGLIRNFPVDEVKEMGADIVIGVYVGSKLEDREELNNLIKILNQSAFMMGILDSDEQKKKVNILIEPDVKDLPNFGFNNSDILIQEGYIAATEFIDEIKQIAEDQKKYNLVKPVPLPGITALEIADTRVPFIRRPFDALANFKYGTLKKGKISLDEIERGITRIFGTKHFDNINYTFSTNGHGDKILNVLAKPRKVHSLSGTFNFQSSSGTSLILTNELRNIGIEPSVMYTTVRLAENYGIRLDFNYRLGKKKDYILNIFSQLHRYDQNLYENEVLREKYAETKLTQKLGIGFEPNNDFFFTIATGIDGYYFKPIGRDDEGLIRYRRFNGILNAELTFDNIDDVQFPSSGVHIGIGGGANTLISNSRDIGLNSLFEVAGDNFYLDGYIKGMGVYSLTEHVAVRSDMAAGIKSESSFTDNFRIGGLEDRDYKSISMLGLNTHQLHMSEFYKLGLALRFELFKSMYLSFKAEHLKGSRTFVLKEMPQDQVNISFWGYGTKIGLRTPLGPVNIAYGRNTFTKSWNTNFTFGYSFF